MAISRANFPKLLEEGLNAVFQSEYGGSKQEWRQVFRVYTSNKQKEEDQQVIGFGYAPEKREGTAISFDEIMQGYTSRYVHKTMGLAFAITKEMTQDNLYQSKTPKYTRGLAKALRDTKEVVHANVLNFAYDNNYKIGDGVSLISNAHPTAAGNQSNVLATAAELSETTLEQIRIMIINALNPRGIEITIDPVQLIIPPELKYDAGRIIKSAKRPGVADNDTNAMRDMDGELKIAIMRRLTNPNRFFVQTNMPEGFKHFVRQKIETEMKGDFNTGNMLYKADERYSGGVTEWRAVYGNGAV